MSRLNIAVVFFKGKKRGGARVVLRTDQAALLGGEGHEDHAAAVGVLFGGEAAGQLHRIIEVVPEPLSSRVVDDFHAVLFVLMPR